MAYCALYKIRGKGREFGEEAVSARVCFSSFYTNLLSFEELELYVLKDYNDTYYKDENKIHFNEEQVWKYAEFLRQAGFVFDLFEVDNLNLNGWGHRKAYKFKILIKQNTNIMNLILINCVRYLYESEYTPISKMFLHLCENDDKEHRFNLLLMSHVILENGFGAGHCILQTVQQPFFLYSIEEIEELIMEEKKVANTASLLKTNTIPNNEQQKLRNKFRDKNNVAEAIEYYKEINKKYGKKDKPQYAWA